MDAPSKHREFLGLPISKNCSFTSIVFHDKSTTQNLKQIWSTGFRNKQKLNT
jgi:hypothetical protein